MRKLIYTTIMFCGLVNAANSQTKIELKDVSKHLGDSVRLEEKIAGVKTFAGNVNAPTLLNLGADFPNQLLSIAVFSSYKTDSTAMPVESNKGSLAIVTGKIELYKGKPQIAVRTSTQLQLVPAAINNR